MPTKKPILVRSYTLRDTESEQEEPPAQILTLEVDNAGNSLEVDNSTNYLEVT